MKIWDVASGTEIKSFTGPRGGVNESRSIPTANGSPSRARNSWRSGISRPPASFTTSRVIKKWVYCVAYSPDGKWLATGGWDRTVKLRDAATGAEALTIFAHEGFVLSLAFSPDSRKLVTTSEDRSSGSGTSLPADGWGRFTAIPTSSRRSPSGLMAVRSSRGGADASIRFWDLKTSRPVVVEQDGSVDQLAFRRDGLRVLSVGDRGHGPKGWNPLTGELDTSLAGTRFEKITSRVRARPRHHKCR